MRAPARLITATAAAALLIGCVSGPAASDSDSARPDGDRKKAGERVLVFSKTAGFRHDSIPDGIAAVKDLGAAHGFTVDATENAGAFTTKNLARYDAVIWLSTTGDVLNGKQQSAFERYIRAGGGYVGVHAAADTEYDWPFYGRLAGAYFQSHPAIQPAKIKVEDHAHPATAHLGAVWDRTDEWYNYRANPRDRARVLATLDESSYSGGTMGGDHPIAWCQGSVDGTPGRSFYTGGGHTKESYADPAFRGTSSAASATPSAPPRPTAVPSRATPPSSTAPPPPSPAGSRPDPAPSSGRTTAPSPPSAAWACSGTNPSSSARTP
ncbi:glycosyl hydrolase [Streptomyces alboflavus]|uniref:Glycosyl hydrolase n=1 Tax=Streptomyces alboflavus TaxID=67267 RepID=A0A1Z1WMI5_9ACTN|nr:glycosyl hydrolase [Streptomyces alboflavus]